jgi:hypothetical protein
VRLPWLPLSPLQQLSLLLCPLPRGWGGGRGLFPLPASLLLPLPRLPLLLPLLLLLLLLVAEPACQWLPPTPLCGPQA